MLKTVTILLLAFLSGCATAPPHQLQNSGLLAAEGTVFEGKATVYVFRGPESPTRPVNISVDGVVQGAIKRQTYIRLGAPPGAHVLLASPLLLGAEPSVKIGVDLENGKSYYFVLNTKFALLPGGTPELTSTLDQIDATRATKMLSTFHQLTPRGE